AARVALTTDVELTKLDVRAYLARDEELAVVARAEDRAGAAHVDGERHAQRRAVRRPAADDAAVVARRRRREGVRPRHEDDGLRRAVEAHRGADVVARARHDPRDQRLPATEPESRVVGEHELV